MPALPVSPLCACPYFLYLLFIIISDLLLFLIPYFISYFLFNSYFLFSNTVTNEMRFSRDAVWHLPILGLLG